MRLKSAVAALCCAAALAAGCTTSDGDPEVDESVSEGSGFSEEENSLIENVAQGVDATIRGEDRGFYGGASSMGGRPGSAELKGDFPDELGAMAGCMGADGVAKVTLNGEGPYDLPCGEAATTVTLTESIADIDDGVTINVEDAPAGSAWVVRLYGPPR